MTLRVALIQLTTSDDPEASLPQTVDLVRRAASGGAQFVLTPEFTNCLSLSRTRQTEVLRREEEDATLAALREEAARAGIWLLVGSLALKTDDPEGRFSNRSVLVAADGRITARYDKIHMFDAALSATETFRESAGYRPGDKAVTARTPFATVGLTVCYDLRFPALYRRLAQAGATILTVPSAFSPATGPHHWAPLLQARAIECSAFVLAPAQTGRHAVSRGRVRETHGHSLVVAPSGAILADGGTDPGVVFADIEPDDAVQARAALPSLEHDRPFDGPDDVR